MQFLTKENADYITDVLKEFLKDKHNIDITDNTISDEEYTQMLSTTMTYVHQTYKLPLQDQNKIVLSELKDKIVNTYKATDAPDQFINKLQKLEIQRKTFTSSIPPPLDVKPADMVYAHPQALAAPISNTPTTSTIYMTAPTTRGSELLVSSWQRDWVSVPERNKFIWKGPLPNHLDTTNVKIGCVVISKEVAAAHPLLSIFIEGPNGYEVHGSILYEKIIGEYAIYKPISEGLSYLYILALPWTITLETCDGEYVSLGSDKIPFHVLETKNNETHIVLLDASDFKVGDQVRVYMHHGKRILPSSVLKKQDNELLLQGVFKEGFLLNFTRQLTIVLETYSMLNKK